MNIDLALPTPRSGNQAEGAWSAADDPELSGAQSAQQNERLSGLGVSSDNAVTQGELVEDVFDSAPSNAGLGSIPEATTFGGPAPVQAGSSDEREAQDGDGANVAAASAGRASNTPFADRPGVAAPTEGQGRTALPNSPATTTTPPQRGAVFLVTVLPSGSVTVTPIAASDSGMASEATPTVQRAGRGRPSGVSLRPEADANDNVHEESSAPAITTTRIRTYGPNGGDDGEVESDDEGSARPRARVRPSRRTGVRAAGP